MVKKGFKIVMLFLAIAFVIIQFFRIERSNPPIIPAETLEAAINVPADVSQILARSCNDCHSHKTIYPWYSQVQPAAWLLQDHIYHGRQDLNFSKFNTYDRKKQARKLDEICEQIENASMPKASYLWIHGDAVLSDSDGKLLCDWANAEKSRIQL